jgi:hypothetical protein
VSAVNVSVYDLLGREVTTLVHQVMNPGSHSVTWNAAGLSSGVYFVRVTAGRFLGVRKVLLEK